ncbi:GNAT family N-acetyltransferase [Vagococcus coleopterorum]|uniref:GNAT family N-acetyltransferase n=1 Tax=Vagococcus coleopterorum TaxID=2714946 RepID=A0A6G8AN52_9ENTE|nr:GNAT family N-acetyltransferase [Vagococcus coleopterorum]QIL46427.1 GNAT family N-acetyltransferase [Vagococcus coleopterorum]
MEFLKAKETDKQEILDIFQQGVAYFKNLGVDQWQDGYPSMAVVESDIKLGQCYIAKEQEQIRGVIVVTAVPESDYEQLNKGAWRYDEPYTAIHRLAINKDFPAQGLSQKLLAYAEEITVGLGRQVIRVDTHEDNKGMQHILKKQGYQLIGDLTLSDDGGERIALDKKLK